MARLARIVIPHTPHHIIQRGNRKQNVFFCDNDKDFYLNLLYEFTTKHEVSICSYTLMDNHVHLVATPNSQESLSRCMGEVHRRYSRMINFRNAWRGYLWQGRYISYPLDERHLYAAVRYIERNPVRAGIVTRPEEYKWSSARSHVLRIRDKILSGDEFILQQIGNWQTFLALENSNDEIDLLRKHAKTGRPLGDNSFIRRLESLSGRKLTKQKPGPRIL